MALLGNLLTPQDEGSIVLWIIRIWLWSSTLVSSNRNHHSIFKPLHSTGNYIQNHHDYDTATPNVQLPPCMRQWCEHCDEWNKYLLTESTELYPIKV